MATVDDLITLLFPAGPPTPVRTGPPNIPLPSDFRELLTRLGGGFEVDNRFYADAAADLPRVSAYARKNLRTVYKRDRVIVREGHSLFTDDPGEGDDVFAFSRLLLWGADDHGNQLFWEASGDPDTWTVVTESRSMVWSRHRMSSVDYLHGLLSRSLRCPAFTLTGWPGPDMSVTLSAPRAGS